MEAVLATIVLLVVVAAALAVLARSWPPSYPLGGYIARLRGGAKDRLALDEERGEANREDDDVRWRWGDPEDPGHR